MSNGMFSLSERVSLESKFLARITFRTVSKLLNRYGKSPIMSYLNSSHTERRLDPFMFYFSCAWVGHLPDDEWYRDVKISARPPSEDGFRLGPGRP